MTEEKVIKENLRLHEKEADEYEDNNPEIFNEQERQRILSQVSQAREYVRTDSSELKALDVGCGTGNMLEKLQSCFAEVVGVDLSREMLSEAYPIFEENENIDLVQGRVADLPFQDDHFDFVSAYSLFHHLPDFSEQIQEISRVLKDGGVLYIDHDPINREEMIVKLYSKFCDILNGIYHSGLPPYEKTSGIDRRYCDYQIHNGDDGGIPKSRIVDVCKREGFEILEDEKYLEYGSEKTNIFYPILKHFISNEWLFLARKKT